MKISQKDESYRADYDDLFGFKYTFAVQKALGNNRKKQDEYAKIVHDCARVRRRNCYYDPCHDEFTYRLKERVKELLKGRTDLILGFNIYLLKKHEFTHPLQLQTIGKYKGKKVKVEENCELPWDVLDTICKTLDFDSHFQFANVCKSWRVFHKIYWRNWLASQEPLLLQTTPCVSQSCSFISIPDQKVYCSEMLKYFFDVYSYYITSSSGYFILNGISGKNSFMLVNPFTKTKKVIDTSTCEFNSYIYHKEDDHALLAFGKCSEEFILVFLCKYNMSLHVYQSRNREWATYSTMENLGKVVDFVVLHDKIYVVTEKANIGVLNLNYANIKFLKLKSNLDVSDYLNLRLVNCDEKLLVVDLRGMIIRNVYKIDFSTMDYIRLETLGDIALFYVKGKQCYALSNPNNWGYERNSIYVISGSSIKYGVYPGDENKLQKDVKLPPLGKYIFIFNWYFRCLKYEVDYSLVE